MAEVLPAPEPDASGAWVDRHLRHLVGGSPNAPVSDIRGGQAAADAALARFDVAGYARRRNEVWPPGNRGASGLSPYVRHGLISLPRLWAHVADGPSEDVTRFRDELLWQEYARHLYARLGTATRRSLRYAVEERTDSGWPVAGDMECVTLVTDELLTRGWLPNQARMWLASHWSVRHGWGWRDGEDAFFRHLLDGSRAANRLGWQWTVGALTGRVYGFSQSQVRRRAPGLCETCALVAACPIDDWPPAEERESRGMVDPRMRRDLDLPATAGPPDAEITGVPEAVWLTAESLGDDDPALVAHPDLPAVFVWDEPLLRRLRLSRGRLVFLAEALADLVIRRPLEVRLGDPLEVLAGRPVAATYAPVPGWRARAARLDVVARYPWSWLVRPHDGPVTSFTAWRRKAGA